MIIVGLDGTLRNNAWRLPIIESEGWDHYHAQGGYDAPHEDVLRIVRGIMRAENMPLDNVRCLTAVPKRLEKSIYDWMLRHNVRVHGISMRPADDWRPEHELKASMVEDLRNAGHNITLAIDDNEKVCEAYRAIGVNVLQWLPVAGGAA